MWMDAFEQIEQIAGKARQRVSKVEDLIGDKKVEQSGKRN